MTGNVYSQSQKRVYLSLESEEFRKEHIIKANKLVRVWVNDSTSYFGFLEFEDSLTIKLNKTLIETKNIVKIKARNKRRSTGAFFTILSPVICGILVDGILKLTDVYGTYTFFPATGAGLYGSAIGTIIVCFVMDRRVYKMDEGIKVEIRSVG